MGRRKYTREFKESAIEHYLSSGKKVNEVPNDLGVNPDNLYRWLRERGAGKQNNLKVFPGQGNPRDEELFQLRKRVADLEETNEILKKAMAFFVVKNPR